MDSLIANGIALSSNASNIHVKWGTRPGNTSAWNVSGYQDSSCVLVSIYLINGLALTCIALKDNQKYGTELPEPHGSNNYYYGMSVVFKTSGTVSIDPSYNHSLGGDVSAYMIIGIS